MKRPLGITLLALLLGWLALGGMIFTMVSPTLAWAGLPWMLYEIAGLAYAGSAVLLRLVCGSSRHGRTERFRSGWRWHSLPDHCRY